MDRHWRRKGKRFCYCFLQDVWSEKPSRIWRKARYYSANSLPYIRQKSFTTALVLFVILHRFFCSRILENSSAFPYSYSEQSSHLKKSVLNTNSHINVVDVRAIVENEQLRKRSHIFVNFDVFGPYGNMLIILRGPIKLSISAIKMVISKIGEDRSGTSSGKFWPILTELQTKKQATFGEKSTANFAVYLLYCS